MGEVWRKASLRACGEKTRPFPPSLPLREKSAIWSRSSFLVDRPIQLATAHLDKYEVGDTSVWALSLGSYAAHEIECRVQKGFCYCPRGHSVCFMRPR